MKKQLPKTVKHFTLLAIIAITSGCAAGKVVDHSDPLEGANRKLYGVNETFDQYLFKPVANTYVRVTPNVARTGVTNFFNNLGYPNVILNSLLQGKFHQGGQDLLRFIYNSTFGIAGLFDVATHLGLPEHDEDLGQTLAVWGLSQGAYLSLPFLGPNTVRNTTDFVPSIALDPLTYLSGGFSLPITLLNIINRRAALLEATNIRDQAALDPYTFTRSAYLQRRQSLIYDGNPPTDPYDDIFEDDELDDELDDGWLIVE